MYDSHALLTLLLSSPLQSAKLPEYQAKLDTMRETMARITRRTARLQARRAALLQRLPVDQQQALTTFLAQQAVAGPNPSPNPSQAASAVP